MPQWKSKPSSKSHEPGYRYDRPILLTARPVAHRGFHDMNKTRWENTLSAFAAAAERGYAIECDVHLSSDRVPVIIHDGDLKR